MTSVLRRLGEGQKADRAKLTVTLSVAVRPAESVTVNSKMYGTGPDGNCTIGVAVSALESAATGLSGALLQRYFRGLPSLLVDLVPSSWI